MSSKYAIIVAENFTNMNKYFVLFMIIVVAFNSCKSKKSEIYRKWQLEDIMLSKNTPQVHIDNFKKELDKKKEFTVLTCFEDSTYTLATEDTVLKGRFVIDGNDKYLKITNQSGIKQNYKITELTSSKLVYQSDEPNTDPVTFVFKAK